MKVVLGSDHLGTDFLERLQDTFPDTRFTLALSHDDMVREAADAEVFLGWPTREVFRSGSDLKWVHCIGTGVDNVEALADIADAGIPITNARGPHTEPMADQTMLFLLSLAHNAKKMLDDQTNGVWDTNGYDHVEVSGSSMGLYGFGMIGRAIARRALGFGMNVTAVDPGPDDEVPGVDVWGTDRLDELFRTSDWLVVACPLTEETRMSVESRRIGLLKPTSSLIVISRGGIVDEGALGAALTAGRISGAALDATDPEPPSSESPFWSHPNVLISSHSSALTPEMYEGRRQIVIENLHHYLAGETLINRVDPVKGY
ncbi:MAG: D-2-hydroxyacid dehydrogenase [Chloroflexi bacterium]|nr:D-2-hydroxyacid dehydrogenase [Chloroflexota bacterium]